MIPNLNSFFCAGVKSCITRPEILGERMSQVYKEGGRAGQKVTWVGAIVNAFLIACKFVAGILGHSQALIADAVHSVSDLFTDYGNEDRVTLD